MKIKKLAGYIAITLLYLISCTKDNEMQPYAPGKGDGAVSGIITDLNNTPVGNATVTGGTDTSITDANGRFFLTKVQFISDSVVMKVTKEGYFQGSKSFPSTNNKVNDVKIQLIPKPAPATISASSGGEVSITGGGSISFTGGFVTASTGNPYTGDVFVSTVYLNSTDQNFSESVPGILTGANASNQQGILQSFGVIAV